jgi:c-di-GMP-binding flagellar brake protein YcgR
MADLLVLTFAGVAIAITSPIVVFIVLKLVQRRRNKRIDLIEPRPFYLYRK